MAKWYPGGAAAGVACPYIVMRLLVLPPLLKSNGCPSSQSSPSTIGARASISATIPGVGDAASKRLRERDSRPAAEASSLVLEARRRAATEAIQARAELPPTPSGKKHPHPGGVAVV